MTNIKDIVQKINSQKSNPAPVEKKKIPKAEDIDDLDEEEEELEDEEETEEEDEGEEEIIEPVPEVKKAPAQKPVSKPVQEEVKEEKQLTVEEEIVHLRDPGVFNVEVLFQMNKIRASLEKITETLEKLSA